MQTPTPTAQTPLAAILARNPANFAYNTTQVQIRDEATGQPTGLVVQVLGQDSPQFKAAQLEVQRARFEKLKRNPVLRDEPPNPDETAQAEAKLVAACVVSASVHGQPAADWPTQGPELEALLIDHAWIRNQLDFEISKRASFMTASSPH